MMGIKEAQRPGIWRKNCSGGWDLRNFENLPRAAGGGVILLGID